jgi:iron complex outermembrane receptor protein
MNKLLIRCIPVLCFLCIASVAHSQGYQWTFHVSDSTTGEAISYATIYSTDGGEITNEKGFASLQTTLAKITIRISSIGYSDYIHTFDYINASTIEIRLTAKPSLLEGISVVSSKYERPLIAEPVSIDIIRPDLATSTASTTLDEVLDKVPGVQMIDGQANIRGGAGYSYGAGSRVLLTVDDVPAMQADAGLPNWSDIPIENMDQIEILKGAASVLYGSAAMNGVINFRTAYATSYQPQTTLSTQLTGYLTPGDKSMKWWSGVPVQSQTNIAHKQKFKRFDLVAGATYLHETPYNKGNYERSGRLYANVRIPLNKQWIFQLNTLINKGTTHNSIYWTNDSTGAYIGDTSTLSTNKKLRFFIDPVLTYIDKSNGEHKLIGRYYSVHNDITRSYALSSDMLYSEYRYHKEFSAIHLAMTTGLVYTGTKVNAELYGDSSFASTNMAAYVQLDKEFFKKLTVTGGFRWEYNQLRSPEYIDGQVIPGGKTSGDKPIFKVGLNYLLSKNASLRASWGQGYRYPTIAEKFINTTAGAIRVSPNPNLDSETGWSAELGFKQGLKIAEWKGYMDISLFRSEYNNMIEFLIQDIFKGFQSFNIGNTRIQGLEFSVRGMGKFGPIGMDLLAGYTYIEPTYRNFADIDTIKSTSNANILKYRMKHNVRVNLGMNWQQWTFGCNYQYNSNMVAIDKIFDVVISGVHDFRAAHNTGFHVFDFRISRSFVQERFMVGLHLNNAFNRAYTYRPGLLEAPRNISVRVTWKIQS